MSDGKVIIDTSLDNTGLKEGLNKLSGIAKTGLKATVGAIAGVGTALGGIGAYAIKVGSNFEEGMSKVSAISGATGEELQALTDKAKEMGAKTKFSATESSEALQYMAMAGWKTEQMLNGLPGIMNLAAASGEDLALTSDIVTDAMTAFGMKAEQAGHFADVLAQASNASNTNVAMLGESFKYVAPLAGSLGYSAEDTSVALGLMANSGIKASQAGTSLKTALVNMAKPTDNMAVIMDRYGLSLTNTDGSMKSLKEVTDMLRDKMGGLDKATQSAAAAQLFGKESLAGMLAIINASSDDYAKLTDAIYNADGAAEKMANTMNDNLKGQITLLKSAVEGLGIELYESVDNPLKDIVKSANTMVGELANAFKENGMAGLVEELGTILSEMVAQIANATPNVVNAAVSLITSFIKGLSDNLPKIANAGIRIIESLIDGISSVLPQVANLGFKIAETLIKNLFGYSTLKAFKEFEKEVKKCFIEIKNTIVKMVDAAVNVLGNLVKILSNIGKVVLPILTKAIKILGDNLNVIIPLITSVYTGFKAYSILSTTTGLIKKMSTAWNAATTALIAHEAANRLTLVTVNGGLPITTMLVGVLTGKISLATAATAAWNAVLNANPIGIVITAVAALTAGIAAYHLMQKDTCTGTEMLEEATERLGESYVGIGEAAANFYNGIKSAGSILDGFNDSIIVSNEEQQNLSTRMGEVQSEITSIARTATNERRGLTESEIQRLDELFAEMQQLTQRELEIQEAYQKVVQDRAQVMADTHQGTLEEYQTYAQQLINSAEETKNGVIQKANEQCTEEIALINSKYEAMGLLGSDQYNAEIEAANNKYTSAVEAANKECGDTLSIIQKGYADRSTELENYITNTQGLNAQEEEENNRYNAALEAENNRHLDEIKTSNDGGYDDYALHKYNIKKIEDEHAKTMAALYDQEANSLNDNVENQAGALLIMASKTEFYGGEVEGKSKEMCDGIIDNFDKLPPKTQECMQQAMSPMLEEMEKGAIGLFKKAVDIPRGIISRIKAGFDIHSPSRKTRQIFKYVMEGAELGIEDETPNLLSQTDDVADNVLNSLRSLDVGKITAQMTAAVNYETAKTGAGLVAGTVNNRYVTSNSYSANEINLEPVLREIRNVANRPLEIGIDGREVAVATAPYQGEWQNYKKGR